MDYVRKTEQRKVHPQEKANFLSKITFFYTFSLFKKIYEGHKFDQDDLYQVLQSQNAENLGDVLERYLQKDIKSHDGQLSIYRVLWYCYGKEYLSLGLLQMIARTFVIMSIPWTLSQVILYFQPNQTMITKHDACLYAYLLIFLSTINVIYLHNYLLYLTSMGVRIRTAFCSVMYRKCLRLSADSLSRISSGKIVTLLTKDVGAFESIIFYANDVWIGCFQTVIVGSLLYMRMGIAAFVGMGFFLIVIPFQVYIGKMASKLRLVSGKNTDERLQVTQEALSFIKVIKIFTWERIFMQKISETRKKEVATIASIFIRKTIIILIGALTSKFAFYLLVMTYLWRGNALSAELIYFISSLFQRIRHALNVVIPMGITESAELSASVRRIESLFEATDVIEHDKIAMNVANVSANISIVNLTMQFDNNKIFDGIDLNISAGLNILTGPLGCGKTTLLKCLLKDLIPQEGTIEINGTVSYAAQEPWIFPSTLQQNILFGEPFDINRYQEVLRVCDLCEDIQHFSKGDQLLVIDNGGNLSSGQKARINLARALYKNRDIYLLDDCLRSLDTRVQDRIFNRCFQEFLIDKLCIFVTQNPRYISNNNYNVLSIKSGKINVNDNSDHHLSNFTEPKEIESDPKVIIETNVQESTEESREHDKLLSKQEKTKIKPNKVRWNIYNKYISLGGGYFILTLILAALTATQFIVSYLEKLISIWVDLEHEIENFKINNLTSTKEYNDIKSSYSFTITLYSLMTLAMVVLSVLTAYAFFGFTRRASNRLHNLMVEKVLNAVMSFFDKSVMGDILNRFSKDLAIVDEQFPFIVFEFLNRMLAFGGIVVLLIHVNFVFVVPVLSVITILYFIRIIYMPTGTVLQRLDVETRSHIIGYLNASLSGLTTIRASRAQTLMTKEFDRHQDLYTSASYTSRCWARAFGFILDIVCCIFMGAITARFVFLDKDTSAGDVGLAITQASMMTSLVQYGIRQWADMENKMTSVERALKCCEIKQEDKLTGNVEGDWPKNGDIIFDKVSLRYPDSDQKILSNLTFTIKAGEKVAVIGRTGAGKSSLISTLHRLYDYDGDIIIDQVNIKSIPLDTLRKEVTMVPQESILFSGSIRDNIDPDRKYQDDQIWNAIEKVGLKSIISSLETTTQDINFSIGRKQLFCLARAIIEKKNIVVLDEANADLDIQTDIDLQQTFKEILSSCTVIAIVHKLHFIENYDRVMALDNGEIVEFGTPTELLRNTDGLFSKMIHNEGAHF